VSLSLALHGRNEIGDHTRRKHSTRRGTTPIPVTVMGAGQLAAAGQTAAPPNVGEVFGIWMNGDSPPYLQNIFGIDNDCAEIVRFALVESQDGSV
jgi:hypothetical protein